MGLRNFLSLYVYVNVDVTRYVTKVMSAALLVFGLSLSISQLLPSSAFATKAVGETPSGKPVFKKRKIKISGHTIVVEIADTEERRAYGLMFREKLGENAGMLFIFDDEAERAFWMQNTFIPLSIGYFSRAKILNEVIDMQPAVMGIARPKTYPSKSKAMYALEMNLGWFDRNKIRPGVSFRFADN